MGIVIQTRLFSLRLLVCAKTSAELSVLLKWCIFTLLRASSANVRLVLVLAGRNASKLLEEKSEVKSLEGRLDN